jgi:hypothetical protein
MFQYQKSLFSFHIECIVKFFIKNTYLWSVFILISNCHDSLNFPNCNIINRSSFYSELFD